MQTEIETEVGTTELSTTVYQPGDGYRYVVAVAPLPYPLMGGGAGSHSLVSVLSPEPVPPLILASDGFLADSYLDEKLRLEIDHPRTAHVYQAIRLALGRQS